MALQLIKSCSRGPEELPNGTDISRFRHNTVPIEGRRLHDWSLGMSDHNKERHTDGNGAITISRRVIIFSSVILRTGLQT